MLYDSYDDAGCHWEMEREAFPRSLMNWMECLDLSASNLLSVKKSLKNARKEGGVILANPSAAKTDYQKARESDLVVFDPSQKIKEEVI
ncbi:hypothetical protein TNCV_3915751 [Trichonephila clavipes]|nr:hypothetical protein TNCV_3915751 [Trichonephila clavipes]